MAEVATASKLGMRIQFESIPIRPEVRAVSDHLGIDPYTSISEGTLIATVRPDHAPGFLGALREEGIEAADVGEITEAEGGAVVVVDGEERPLEHPGLDPFWEAFGRWAEEAAQEI